MNTNTTTNVVAVFAHNEAEKIVFCLQSIKNASETLLPDCYVLVNGCTDRTSRIVSRFSKEHPFVHLVEIKMADKCNAWNVFVHDVAPEADIYFFVDGDVEVLPNSFSRLRECLALNPKANAAAAVPADCGRTSKTQRSYWLNHNGLAGNFYALSKHFVDRLRLLNVYLPIGFIGDDFLVGALAYWDLDPKNQWDRAKIVPCEEAQFKYKSLSVFRKHDLQVQHKRMVRYGISHWQNKMIGRVLKENGIDGMPTHAEELYEQYARNLVVTWRGAATLYDWFALRLIRRYRNGSHRTP